MTGQIGGSGQECLIAKAPPRDLALFERCKSYEMCIGLIFPINEMKGATYLQAIVPVSTLLACI